MVSARWHSQVGIGLLVVGTAYLAVLVHPDPLFPYTSEGNFIVVHADTPVPQAAEEVIRLAEEKVRRSPLFVSGRKEHIYICRHQLLWALLTRANSRARAVALAPFGHAIFVREARFEINRLAGPHGDDGPLSLDTYLAHEVTHDLTEAFLGPVAYLRLPSWVREGYADYVARDKGSISEAGYYLPYVSAVVKLLDDDGWTVAALLASPPTGSRFKVGVEPDASER